ncbi:MAG TPA: serine/threonine-protein kinase [Gemmataceae bacterium]|nr:serine/threonine-protein kinase [Gemmataceae bacterium]
MSIGDPATKSSPPLADILAERKQLPVYLSIRIAAAILHDLRELHASGRIHGRIRGGAIRFDASSGDSALAPPDPVCSVGGVGGDPNLCPPELQRAEPFVLPTRIEDAERLLAEAKLATSPRGIDLHQVAALLAQMLTGSSLANYLRSARVKNRIPSALHDVIDRGLAFRPSEQFRSCDEFLDALESAAKEQGVSLPRLPTPSTSVVAGSAPTPRPVTSSPVTPAWNAPASDSSLSAEAPPDLPFDRLGHYRLVRRLGCGGMGDVYLAHEEALERLVAIKILPPELALVEEFVRRFRLEATAVARLNHPNVVPIHFIGSDSGRHYFAMQYVEGQSLEQLLREKGKLDADETIAILKNCLAGLAAAHRAGLIHRDVKPANILLETKTRRALVADFGLVKSVGLNDVPASGAPSGVVMGTVDYIAPEQAHGEEVDGRADLYALGVMSYRMLSGRLPFSADSTGVMVFQHAFEPPPPLREIAPEVPERLAILVERLMSKQPESRFADCEEVLGALDSLSVDVTHFPSPSPLPPRPVLPPTGTTRPRPRRTYLLAAMTAMAGCLLLATIAWLRLPPSDPLNAIASSTAWTTGDRSSDNPPLPSNVAIVRPPQPIDEGVVIGFPKKVDGPLSTTPPKARLGEWKYDGPALIFDARWTAYPDLRGLVPERESTVRALDVAGRPFLALASYDDRTIRV